METPDLENLKNDLFNPNNPMYEFLTTLKARGKATLFLKNQIPKDCEDKKYDLYFN